MKRTLALILAAIMILSITACGGGSKKVSAKDLATYRDISWEGTELTVKLGENKTTGCNWKNEFGDDSIIDYSINRKFTLSDGAAMQGLTAGVLSAGFEGKKAGTTTITFTTPCDWEGNTPGYTYVVTVEVAADGTIVNATGE
ncbi:MAG: protease inhibitor I42 family protein [Clostridia bacterium]|nr:protease inhibitor I42 family protein [Clostridia bacterium]